MMRKFFLLISFLWTINSLTAQFLTWQFEDIVTDAQESGAAPSVLTDDNGNIHLTYWKTKNDQMVYGFRDQQTGKWSFSLIPVAGNYGYRSSLKLDVNNQLHLAFMQNEGGEASLHYGSYDGNNWVIEDASGGETIGNYGYDPLFPTYTQPSLDLFFQPDGNPAILHFNGFYSSIKRCDQDNSVFEIYSLYRMDMNIRSKGTDGNWTEYPFGVMPYNGPKPCLTKDRYGEFCKMLQVNDTSFYALTVSLHDHELLLFSNNNDSLNDWTMSVLDTTDRILGGSTERFYEGFGFLDATITNDSILHATYNVSHHYGEASTISGRNTFYYLRYNLNKAGETGYTPYIYNGPITNFGPQAYQNSLTALNDSVVMITYFNRLDETIVEQFSMDRGQTWTERVIDSFTTRSQLKSIFINDSLIVFGHFGETDQLWMAKRHFSDTTWTTTTLTSSNVSATVMSSDIYRNQTEDNVFVVFNEEVDNRLIAGTRTGNNWSFDTLLFDNANVEALSLKTDESGEPKFIYVNSISETMSFFQRENNSWGSEVLLDTALALDPELLTGNNGELNVFYFDFNDRRLHRLARTTANSPWSMDIVDTTGLANGNIVAIGRYPSAEVSNNGTLHVAYLDILNAKVKYAMLNSGSGWQTEEVTFNFQYSPSIAVLALDNNEQPIILFRDSQKDSLFLAQKGNSSFWEIEAVEGNLPDFSGTDLDLVIDNQNKPWIVYNVSSTIGDIRMSYRSNQGTWVPVSVLENTGEISSVFDFHLVDRDFYIIGKKNQLDNNGLGLLYAENGLNTLAENTTEKKNLASIYPNPVNEEINLSWNQPRPAPKMIEVYNSTGQLVHNLTIESKLENGTVKISVKEWNEGIYYVVMREGADYQVERLVVVH